METWPSRGPADRPRGVRQLQEEALDAGQLAPADGQACCVDRGLRHSPLSQLPKLGGLQLGHVAGVPLEETRRQTGHEDAVERMAGTGEAEREATHVVSRVQAHPSAAVAALGRGQYRAQDLAAL